MTYLLGSYRYDLSFRCDVLSFRYYDLSCGCYDLSFGCYDLSLGVLWPIFRVLRSVFGCYDLFWVLCLMAHLSGAMTYHLGVMICLFDLSFSCYDPSFGYYELSFRCYELSRECNDQLLQSQSLSCPLFILRVISMSK